jgi:hypothetical protein
MGFGYAECYICGAYAESGYNIGKERYLDDPSIYRCRKCYDMEIKIREIRVRRLEKRVKRREKSIETFSTKIEEIEKPKYDPDKDTNLTKVKVKDLSERWVKKIPEDHHEKEIYIVNDNSRKKTGIELIDILNERFVRRQLELMNRIANNRDIYYQILTRIGTIDLKGDSLQQQISLDGSVKAFCDKLTDFFEAPYWGYIQDELTIMSSARTTCYTIQGKSYDMDKDTITKKFFGDEKNEFYYMIRKTPFFFVICEKELVIRETMEALRDLGYTEGWLGFNTQGYSSTWLIRTLIEYKDKISKKFCVFFLHDYDVEGIKIFLDTKRYFLVESAGLNPELMLRSGIDFKGKGQDYRGKTGKAKPATIKGAMTIIDDLYTKKIITSDEKREYIKWVGGCSDKRFELQSITGARLDEGMELNPARDFAEYLQHKIEDLDRIWDLTRLEDIRPIDPDPITFEFSRPAIITQIVEEMQNRITETIDKLLDFKNLGSREAWRKLLREKYAKLEEYQFMEKILNQVRNLQIIHGKINAIRVRKKNKRYRDSLKKAKNVLRSQRNEMWNLHYNSNRFLTKQQKKQRKLIERLFNRLPEYIEIKEKLENLQEQVEKALEEIEKEIEEKSNKEGNENE